MPPRVPVEKLMFARTLRRRMTKAETILWTQLRSSRLAGAKFRRQVPLGRYIADFLCVEAMLIIELDGAPHERADRQAQDAARDQWLGEQGYRVVRFSNDLIIGGCQLVLDEITAALREQRRIHPLR